MHPASVSRDAQATFPHPRAGDSSLTPPLLLKSWWMQIRAHGRPHTFPLRSAASHVPDERATPKVAAETIAALLELQESTYLDDRSGLSRSWPPEHAMDAVQLARFLEGHRLCLLATTSPRGEPQIRPVRFTVDGHAFWIVSGPSERVRNLAQNPHGSLAVLEGEGPTHRFLLAEGALVTHSSASHHLRRLWRTRHGGDPGSFATAWLELTPSRLFTYHP